jgi:hypothetical protein
MVRFPAGVYILIPVEINQLRACTTYFGFPIIFMTRRSEHERNETNDHIYPMPMLILREPKFGAVFKFTDKEVCISRSQPELAKKKMLVRFVGLSVCQHENNSTSTQRIFVKFRLWEFY